MRILLIVAALTALAVAAGSPVSAQTQAESCPDVPATSAAAEAFDAYCVPCHAAQKLADSYFRGAQGEAAAARETELAAFLDRHSACPHRHHEELAAWLRELASAQ